MTKREKRERLKDKIKQHQKNLKKLKQKGKGVNDLEKRIEAIEEYLNLG